MTTRNIIKNSIKDLNSNKIIGITIFITLVHLLLYIGFQLRGNFRYLPLTAELFGVPQPLADKGIKPFYLGKQAAGWDGQFYYYMSNDPIDINHFSKNIDSPAYRYQRIGMSIIPFAASKVLGLDWVSPELFFICYLLVFIGGLFSLKYIFLRLGVNPWWIAGWGLFAATQITIFNFLPDAAADALLFIAIYFLLIKRSYLGYAVAASLSSLSREIYILIFAGIFLTEARELIKKPTRDHIFKALPLAAPGVSFILWQFWCRVHFQVSPSSLATGVLGFPIVEWFKYLSTSHTIINALGMIGFFIILIYQLNLLIEFSKKYRHYLPAIFSFAIIIFLYLSFGKTVLEDWTGFLKPASLFLVTLPLTIKLLNKQYSRWLKITLTFFLVTSFSLLYCDRIIAYVSYSVPLAGLIRDPNHPNLDIPKKAPCDESIDVKKIGISLIEEEPYYENETLRKIFMRRKLTKMRLLIKNNSTKPLPIAKDTGDTRLGYSWKNVGPKDAALGGDTRSLFESALLPGQEKEMTMVIQMPRELGTHQLNISLLQEGCYWFNQKDPTASWQKDYTIE